MYLFLLFSRQGAPGGVDGDDRAQTKHASSFIFTSEPRADVADVQGQLALDGDRGIGRIRRRVCTTTSRSSGDGWPGGGCADGASPATSSIPHTPAPHCPHGVEAAG